MMAVVIFALMSCSILYCFWLPFRRDPRRRNDDPIKQGDMPAISSLGPLRKGIWLICVAVLYFGIVGFFAPAIDDMFSIWPNSREWPVGYATDVVTTKGGMHIVPHISSGRIQICDRDWKFVRGWKLDEGGGYFKLTSYDESKQQIGAMTARGKWKYLFDLNGNVLSKAHYTPGLWSKTPAVGQPQQVRTAIWLMPFASPFIAWLMAVLGGIGMRLSTLEKLPANLLGKL